MASTNTRFTALGMSGSGKTCYVLGMYYQMITGYKGFSLKADGDSVSRLENTCGLHIHVNCFID